MIKKILPYIIYSFFYLIALFLEAEFFSNYKIFGAKPDILMIIVIFTAIKTNRKNGAIAGIIAGFWYDLFFAPAALMGIAVYGMLGFAVGLVREKIGRTNVVIDFYSVLFGSLFCSVLMVIAMAIIGDSVPLCQSLMGIGMPMTFYNLILMFVGFPLMLIWKFLTKERIVAIDLCGRGIVYRQNKKNTNKRRSRRRENYDYQERDRRESPRDIRQNTAKERRQRGKVHRGN